MHITICVTKSRLTIILTVEYALNYVSDLDLSNSYTSVILYAFERVVRLVPKILFRVVSGIYANNWKAL